MPTGIRLQIGGEKQYEASQSIVILTTGGKGPLKMPELQHEEGEWRIASVSPMEPEYRPQS